MRRLLALLTLALTLATGCNQANAHRAALAAQQASYGVELNACYESSKTWATYEACADKVDAKYGVKP